MSIGRPPQTDAVLRLDHGSRVPQRFVGRLDHPDNLKSVITGTARLVPVVDAVDEMLAGDLERFAVIEFRDEDVAEPVR